MELWLWVLLAILAVAVIILTIKICLLRKSAREIREAFAHRVSTDTNTLIDISGRDREMRALAEGINVQLRKLRRERHRFKQGDQDLKEAVTNISHDIRTPLTAICGYLNLLRQEETSETAARYLRIIEERTEEQKRLTEELFCYSVVTSAAEDVSREEVTLNHVLEESLLAYYGALTDRGITPDIAISDERVIRSLNKNSLIRIFDNVIGNALKYSDGDLKIGLSQGGEITFSNHASGLDEIQTERLFNRFYTVETGKKSTGLGLSIARMLTEQMGGSIAAKYRDGILYIHIFFPE